MNETLTPVIYIAGPMKGDPEYQTRFNAAESYLSWKGWIVLNPAMLPQGMQRDAYLPICLAMVQAADAIVLLAGSEHSEGAQLEEKFARYQGGKIIYHGIEEVPTIGGEPEC